MNRNSACLYGESIFTSFRSYNGRAPFLKEHLNRLYQGVNEYYLNGLCSFDHFISFFEITEKIKMIKGNRYYRLTIYSSRGDISSKPFSLSELRFDFYEKELTLEGVGSHQVSCDLAKTPFSDEKCHIKGGSYFQNLYLKRKAISRGFNDVILFNEQTITEASTSNIILRDKDSFYSPKSSSIFTGITLFAFEKFLEEKSQKLQFQKIRKDSISDYSEVFMLNSVIGINSVDRVGDCFFTNGLSDTINEFKDFLGRA